MKSSFRFFSSGEKKKYLGLLIANCLASGFDFLGVMALGYLTTSIAMFVINGSSSSRTIHLLGLVIPAANVKILPSALLLILSFFIAKAALSIMLTKQIATLLAKVESRAAVAVVSSVLGKSLDEYRSTSREELLYASSSATTAAFSGIMKNVTTLISEGFMFIGLLVAFFLVDPWATFSVIAYFGLVAYLIQYFIGKKLTRAARAISQGSISANRAVNDLISAFRELFVAGKRGLFFDKLFAARESSATAQGTQTYLASMPRYIIETAMLLGIFAFGGAKLLSGDLVSSMTTLAVFFTGSMRILAALLPWQGALIELRRDAPQAAIAQKYLARESKDWAQPTLDQLSKQSEALSLDLDNVSYTYPGSTSPALNGVSMNVTAGEHVAIIGPSGSGKSTLADLMLGLVLPESGRATIGSKNAFEVLAKMPGALAYVPQKPGILNGTVAENIAIGEEQSTSMLEKLDVALDRAHLSELVNGLTQGADTFLGATNDALSGGQLQRVGLARALYHLPGLLVLDEATSALDAESERQITEAIMELRGKVTVVIVAHRLNTVQHADRVFLLDGGCVVDSGKFSEIVARNKSVARAVELMGFED